MDMPPPIFLIERIDYNYNIGKLYPDDFPQRDEEYRHVVTYRATREHAMRAMQELLAEVGRKGATYGGYGPNDIYPRFAIIEVPYVEPEPGQAEPTTFVSPDFVDSLIKAGKS